MGAFENATKMDQVHSMVGSVIGVLMLLVIIIVTWRAFFVPIHARANYRLRKLESQLIALHSAIEGGKMSWLTTRLLMGLSYATS